MTKSHSSGLAISNLFHVGNVSGLRKPKTQSKSESMEFPALISQQDANLTVERLAKKVSESHIISDDERAEIPARKVASGVVMACVVMNVPRRSFGGQVLAYKSRSRPPDCSRS